MYGLWGNTELWDLIENSQCLRKNSWYFTGYGLRWLWVKTVTTVESIRGSTTSCTKQLLAHFQTSETPPVCNSLRLHNNTLGMIIERRSAKVG
jgi:hypothetical protein